MSAPKSVVKIKKNGVEYTSYVDQANYYLFELTRAALRDVGRFICKKFNGLYYEQFHRRTGKGGRAPKYKVWSGKNTQYPRVQVGLKHATKGNEVKGFYSFFQEFGTSKTKRLGLLTKSAQDNVAEIVKIESQYLSALEGEASRLQSLIDENDMEGDADE